MERFEVVPAGRVYANQLAPHLRMSDKIEVWRASGMQPLDALLDSIDISDEDMCWTATLNRLPVAMFGVNEIAPDTGDGNSIGGIWLLGSYGLYQNIRDFHRKSREYLARMHERYKYLTNFVDVENVPTRRWLKHLGFTECQQIEEFGFGKTPFIQVVSERK